MKNGVMKKALGASIFAMSIAFMTGCGGSSSDGTKEGKASETADIVIWTQMENETDLLQKYAEQWGKETGNHVTVINQDTDIQQFSQAAASADGPDGLFGIPNDQLPNYVSANLVQEVPEDLYNDDDFVDAAIQSVYIDGKKYAAPISVESPVLFYNTDKVSEVPETWEEMIETAKDNGGIAFEVTSVYYDLGFLRAYDSYIFNYKDNAYDTSDIGLGNSGAVEAYTLINKMANEYGFFSSDITYDLAKSSFQNGEAAFYIGGAWDVEGFTEAGTKFAVTDMPTLNGKDFVTPVGTYVGFVSSKSDAQEAVFEFYKYIIDNALVDIYKDGGRIPAAYEAQRSIDDTSEVTQAQIAQCEKGEPLPTVSEMGLIWQPFSDNIKLMFSGTITPQEAADYIDEQVKEAIAMMQSGK